MEAIAFETGNDIMAYIKVLESTVDDLNRQLNDALKRLPDTSSIDAFVMKISGKSGRVYGWKTDYIEASKADNCTTVTSNMINEWIRDKRIPVWAYEQVDRMIFTQRLSKKYKHAWTIKQTQFLANLYRDSPTSSDAELAFACTQEFGRTITECAIKGALYRLRRKQAIVFRKFAVTGVSHVSSTATYA